MKKKFKIDRLYEDENTTAIISFKHKDDLNIEETLSLITSAVTKWIENTEEGKAAWEYSCEDFNIGDLASYTNDKDLIKYFKEVGLKKVCVEDQEYESSNDVWSFDTILANSEELEEI